MCFSCSTKLEVNEEVRESVAPEIAIMEPTFIDSLVGNGGVIRGVEFGMSIDEVRGVETAQHDETSLDENGVRMVRFVEDFSISRSMDVEYYFSLINKLDKIVLVVYCDSNKRQGEVYLGLSNEVKKMSEFDSRLMKVGDEHNFNVELLIKETD